VGAPLRPKCEEKTPVAIHAEKGGKEGGSLGKRAACLQKGGLKKARIGREKKGGGLVLLIKKEKKELLIREGPRKKGKGHRLSKVRRTTRGKKKTINLLKKRGDPSSRLRGGKGRKFRLIRRRTTYFCIS